MLPGYGLVDGRMESLNKRIVMPVVLVTGSDGLVGTAIRNVHNKYPEYEFYFATRKDGDLTKEQDVANLFKSASPDHVVHTAAHVGGVKCQLAKPGEMFYKNILMNTFMIHYAQLNNVKKFICFSSLCTFPHDVRVLTEEVNQVGEPFVGNYAYGYAKRMSHIQIRAYGEQYGTKYSCFVLTNTYGPGDNWNLENGHVVAGLVHKCYLAKKRNTPLVLWGSGTAVREFIFSEDIAECTLKIMFSDVHMDKIILSSGEARSIKEIAKYVAKSMAFENEITCDSVTTDGQSRRICDNSLLKKTVPDFKFTSVEAGIKKTTNWFVDNYPNLRL